MKVWNLTVKTAVAPKRWNQKTEYRKDKLWFDSSGIPVLGGRWWQQAQSILDDAEKRREMRKAIWTRWIVLHWDSENLLSQRKSFIIWNCRLWKFNQLKPSFPDGTQSYHKAWICHEAMCKQKTEWSEGASSEKSILRRVKAGTKTQVFDDKLDLRVGVHSNRVLIWQVTASP